MNKSELVKKALTDPSFRTLLQTQPAKALGVKTLTPENKKLVDAALVEIKAVESKAGAMADELLCADGGPCGIASPADRTLKKNVKRNVRKA